MYDIDNSLSDDFAFCGNILLFLENIDASLTWLFNKKNCTKSSCWHMLLHHYVQ